MTKKIRIKNLISDAYYSRRNKIQYISIPWNILFGNIIKSNYGDSRSLEFLEQ